MLRVGKVGLRARDEADVAVLHAELYEDIATLAQADSRPWLPIPPGSAASPYAVTEPRDDLAFFSVVELDSGELAGEALLWAIDLHNRMAHLGLSLRPAFRGRGLGTDVVSGAVRLRLHHPRSAPVASRHPGQQYSDDTGCLASRVRAGGQAPPLGVGQRGFRRRGDPRDARHRLGRGGERASGRGRDRRQARLTARNLSGAGPPGAPTVMSGLKPGHHFPTR